MTTLKELKGTRVQSLASDPSNPVEGQIWYNTTSNNFKVSKLVTAGAWSSGGNLVNARNKLSGA